MLCLFRAFKKRRRNCFWYGHARALTTIQIRYYAIFYPSIEYPYHNIVWSVYNIPVYFPMDTNTTEQSAYNPFLNEYIVH